MSRATLLLDRPPAARPAPAPAPAPPARRPPGRPKPNRKEIRQLVVGLLALPLTLLPFLAYLTLTPEGRLVRDRAMVALSPPTLPTLSADQVAAAAAAAPRYEGAVMALAYHGIGSAADGEGGFVISPARFGEHLATLKAAGMQTVTAAQVADAFAGGATLPANAVMLTFDDGRADAMMFADPLLAEAGMSATMFVIAGSASKPGIYYASWPKIESYAASGRWDIQSHTTASHREHRADGGGSLPALTSRAPGESLDDYRARIVEDLDTASAAITTHVGRPPVAFAYPFGAYGADRSNDPAIADVVREEVGRRYALAFQQDDQETVPLLTPDHDRLRLRRLEVEDWSGLDLLERITRARQVAPPEAPAAEPAPDAALPGPGADADGGENEPGDPASTGPSTAGSTSTARPGTAPVAGGGGPGGATAAASGVAPPPASVPPATVAPPAPTVPPSTAPPPVVTSPPTTTRPTVTTVPATTSPPTTAPPTTVCKEAGKSGKCVPAGG